MGLIFELTPVTFGALQVPRFFEENRESGETPGRTQRCEGGFFALKTTGFNTGKAARKRRSPSQKTGLEDIREPHGKAASHLFSIQGEYHGKHRFKP